MRVGELIDLDRNDIERLTLARGHFGLREHLLAK
jgi:hypothetical protein